jgi:hypothetical protein
MLWTEQNEKDSLKHFDQTSHTNFAQYFFYIYLLFQLSEILIRDIISKKIGNAHKTKHLCKEIVSC